DLLAYHAVERGLDRAGDVKFGAGYRQRNVGDVDLPCEIGDEPPIGGDRRPRGGDDAALEIDFLIERAAGEMLHLLADIAAEELADGAADRAGARADAARHAAERLERAGQRRGDDERLGPARHDERPAGHGKTERRVGQQLYALPYWRLPDRLYDDPD